MKRAALLLIWLLALAPLAHAGGGPDVDATPAPPVVARPETPSETPSEAPATSTPAPAPAPAPDPSARLPEGSAASEHWDVLALLDSGHRVFARFLVTNVGPGRRTAVAVGHVLTPQGEIHDFHSARREGSWKLLEGGRVIDIGASEFGLREGGQWLDVHKPKLNVRLDFALEGGASAPSGLLPRGYHVDRLGVDLDARASVRLAGMAAPQATRARVAITHTWSETAEADVALRRTEIFSFENDRTAQITEFLPPVGDPRVWATVTQRHESVSLTSGRFEPGAGVLKLSRKRYAVPETWKMEGDDLTGQIALQKPILEHDPLGDLPQPFRWLVGRTMSPHRVWADSVIEVTIPPRPTMSSLQFSGTAVTVVTFLNPVEKP